MFNHWKFITYIHFSFQGERITASYLSKKVHYIAQISGDTIGAITIEEI